MIMEKDSIKTMMEDMFASYEQGVKSMSPIFSVAALLLAADSEPETDRIQLREALSQNGNLRNTDFERMMTAITEPRRSRAHEIRLLLREFLQSQQEMIAQLGGYFAQVRGYMENGDIENIKPVFARIKEMVALQEQAKQQLEIELAEQENEQNEVMLGIKSLLQKGRELQVRDFKEMLAGIKHQSTNRMEQNRLRREAVSQMLAGYKEQRLKNESIRRVQ